MRQHLKPALPAGEGARNRRTAAPAAPPLAAEGTLQGNPPASACTWPVRVPEREPARVREPSLRQALRGPHPERFAGSGAAAAV